MQLEVYGPSRYEMAGLLIEQGKEVNSRRDCLARVVCLQLIDEGGYDEALQQFQQAYAESREKWGRCKQLLGMDQI
ncbi:MULTISPECIES: hypothetical protein [Chromobacterium]|uniref:hypothetical protein n=1 Tax=Chromobacterium TaxID=535 RepID=UPI001887D4B8|nr:MULTISPECIES: hypothetical protein [Chromobacterium]QOZ83163.1 hypothetical protein DXT74_08860 [Chromobacterium sp. Rain0013]WON83255.1 hypothetical protein OK026_19300 [Chromobacterium haemolyticum]